MREEGDETKTNRRRCSLSSVQLDGRSDMIRVVLWFGIGLIYTVVYMVAIFFLRERIFPCFLLLILAS